MKQRIRNVLELYLLNQDEFNLLTEKRKASNVQK